MKKAMFVYAIVCGLLGGTIGRHFGQIWTGLLPLILLVVLLPAWLIVVSMLGLPARWQMERMMGPLPPPKPPRVPTRHAFEEAAKVMRQSTGMPPHTPSELEALVNDFNRELEREGMPPLSE